VTNLNLWLIGAGKISQNYFYALKKLNNIPKIIGRGIGSASNFQKNTGFKVETGGLKINLKKYGIPKSAIVAVNNKEALKVAKELIKAGVSRILLEKPGVINIEDARLLQNLSKKNKKNKIFIAYNRRFCQSVIKAKKIIKKDGGILSLNFDFTEWSDRVKKLDHIGANIKKNWVIANSSHVIDLAFHLCGKPKKWSTWQKGKMDWHPSAARFCGSGITNKGIIFSYLSDWEAPGRWGIELMTTKHRIILRPIEKLKVIKIKSTDLEPIEIKNNFDIDFKPGFLLQTKAFLLKNDSDLCSLNSQFDNIKFFNKIAGYRSK